MGKGFKQNKIKINAKDSECATNQFTCGDGRCIPLSFRCDGDVDCENGADEQKCSCRALGMFECSDLTCIQKSKVCDGQSDCSTGEDESNCTKKRGAKKECSQDKFWCAQSKQCLSVGSRIVFKKL